jgi:hypothetical protein
MKKILSLIIVLGAAVAVHAQGTFNGNTVNSDPNFDHSGGTVRDTTAGNALATGTAYTAQYYAGPQGAAESSLVAIDTAKAFGTGGFAGYFQPGTVTDANAAGGTTVTVQLRAWKGTGGTYEAASVRGVSNLIDVALVSSVNTPNSIGTLANFTLAPVPEPATIALGLMGASALLIRRRK